MKHMPARKKHEERLRQAYNQRDDVQFEAALQDVLKHFDFLNAEIVRYRDGLNEIAWPKDTINGPLPRKVAIRTLNVSAIGKAIEKHFTDAFEKAAAEVKPVVAAERAGEHIDQGLMEFRMD